MRASGEEASHDPSLPVEAVLDWLPTAVIIKDAHPATFGQIIQWNTASERLLGYTRQQVLGKTVFEMLSPEQAACVDRMDHEAWASGDTVSSSKERVDHATLGPRWLQIARTPIHDAQGMPQYLVCTCEDITERIRDDADRGRLAAAVEQAGEAIIITDAEGIIHYVNPAFSAITGYSPAEAIGQNPRLVKSGQQDEAFYKKLWETISSGRTWQGRFVNKRKDGSLFTEEATLSPVRDATGTIVHYVGVKRDITAHICLSDQLQHAQKMESVGRLAGGVAHDFNNRLCVILGCADLALEGITAEHQLFDELQAIRESARSAVDVTRRLLAFARKQVVSPRVLDLNATISEMLGMMRRLIGGHMTLRWHPGEGLWPVRIDPAQIDQILANLCVNAADALDGNSAGMIDIMTDQTMLDEPQPMFGPESVDPGAYVRLSVSDNGCGMDRGTLAHIFEPFFTTKAVGKGTGLGLSTIYGIVKQNGGFVNVYSEPGCGSRFTIYLPRHCAGTEAKPESLTASVRSGRPLTVLLAEDDPTVLSLTAQMLRRLGHTVLSVAIPEDALRLAGSYAGVLDLLITDVVMPGLNGRDLADRLSAQRPTMQVLFISGYTADVIASNGVLEKGVHFLQKPYTTADLAAKIRDVVRA